MLDKICPYYMMYGMSYDEFWNGDYTKLKYYAEKHQLEIEKRNEEMWMQGFYFYEGLDVALHNHLSVKQTQKRNYPDKPHRITPLTELEKEQEKKKTLETFTAQLMSLSGRLEKREKARQGSESKDATSNLKS